MTPLGSVSGEGRLSVGDQDLGGVDYVLRGSVHGELKFIAGQLTGNARGIIATSVESMASSHGDARLRLENGDMMKIHVYQATITRGLFQAMGTLSGTGPLRQA